MPTAQARLTRTRGLHATRSSIRSDNDMNSLPERRVACIFFFSRWHRARTMPPPKFQDSDLRRPIAAWFPGASDLRALSWAHLRVRGAAERGCHIPGWLGIDRFARSSYVNRALFGIPTSTDRWPSSQARMTSVPCHGYICASGEPLGAAATHLIGCGVRVLRVPPM